VQLAALNKTPSVRVKLLATMPDRTGPVALLWDNDGVLVETEPLYFQATREVLASIGAELDEASYRAWFLLQGTGAWHLARALGHDDASIAALKRARNARYAELLDSQELAIPGVHAAVASLAAHHRMAIVTTSAADHFARIHHNTGLLPHFEFALTRGDYARSKPDPEPYRCALQRMGLLPEQCLVIEDSERGLLAATAAGIPCWVVPSRFTRGQRFASAARVLPDLGALVAALLEP
jgi:HAD superfamily hydrolase (TIGR01509 family)